MAYGGLTGNRVPPTLADWSTGVAARKKGGTGYGGLNPHQVAANVNRTGQGQTIQVGSGPSGGTHTIYPSAGGGGYGQHRKNLQQGQRGTVAPGGIVGGDPSAVVANTPQMNDVSYSQTGGDPSAPVERTPQIDDINYAKSATGGLQGVPDAIAPATDLAGVYQNQLGREPDAEGMAWYQNQIDTGQMTFDQARQAIIKSEEGRGYNTQREQYIADAYQKAFGRPVDPEGMDFYLNNPDQLPGLAGTLDASQEGGTAGGEQTTTAGAAETIEDYYDDATTATETYKDDATKILEESVDEATDPLNPYSESGIAAQNMLDDLAGVNGPEAQQAAYDAYQSSPALAAKLQETEDALARQASATGQLGSGNLLKGLQENAVALHDKDFQDYLTGLQTTAAGGLTAGQDIGSIKSQYGRDVAGVAGDVAKLDVNSAQWAGTGISNAQLETAFQTGQWAQDAAWQQAQLDVMQTNKLDGLLESSEDTLMDIISGTLASVTATQATNLKFLVSIDAQLASDLVNTFGSGSTSTGGSDPLNVQIDAMKIIDNLTNAGTGTGAGTDTGTGAGTTTG